MSFAGGAGVGVVQRTFERRISAVSGGLDGSIGVVGVAESANEWQRCVMKTLNNR